MTHPPACRCVTCALTRLRMLLHAETPTVINTHAAPILRDHEGIPERQTDEGGTGLPFTAAFHRHIGHPDGWGLSRLGMASIIEVSEKCSVHHPPHRRPLFTRTVCGQLVFEAAYLGQEPADLVFLHPDLDADVIAGLLAWALSYAEGWREERFARLTREPGHEAPLPERRRVA